MTALVRWLSSAVAISKTDNFLSATDKRLDSIPAFLMRKSDTYLASYQMNAHEHLLNLAYLNFNNRAIDGALALMHPNVKWPNGMEGGFVYGHQEIRDYWTRQWTLIDPHVEPVSFTVDDDGRIRTEVHQFIKDQNGAVLIDEKVYHIYQIEDGLIRRMDIEHVE